MKLFNEYIISYDIEDNKNRNKLYNSLKDLGLIPIQKSVFWGMLKQAEEKMLPILFKKYCKDNDKAFFAKVKLANQIIKNSIGHKKSDFEIRDYEII